MATVDGPAAKTPLLKLLDPAEADEEFIIARAGNPIARLVAIHAPKPPRTRGCRRVSSVRDDVDAPLPDEVLADFGARRAAAWWIRIC